ncbi:MAG: hypothetical protein AB7K68_02995 [Bacteriovoracia bacterium]
MKQKLLSLLFFGITILGSFTSWSEPAFATPFLLGEAEVLPSEDTGNSNVLIAQSAVLSQAGTITSISIYSMEAAGNLYLGIYDATGPSGGPGALLATTASFTPVAGWNTANVSTPTLLQAGTYWLAYLPSNDGFYSAGTIGGSSSGVYYSRSFGTLPSTFSNSPSTSSYHWSLYATLTPQPATMGDTNVLLNEDTNNSNVLIAQSVTLSQSAMLDSLSIYAMQAAGNVYLGVYDASGPSGGPGQLLATTSSFAPTSGWNMANVISPVLLQAGTYWIAYLPSSDSFYTAGGTGGSSSGVYYSRSFGALPATFSTSPSTTASHWSFYATLTPSSAFTLGQKPFAVSSSWNTPIAANTTYTNVSWPTSTGYNYSVSWDSYSAAIYVSSPTDPIVTVTYPSGWGYPGGTLNVRMPAEADGAPGTDGELLVIDGTTVHNFWIFERTSLTTATASSYGSSDLFTGTGWGTSSPFLGAGITASGSNQLAGILVEEETNAGEIQHALNIRGDSTLVAAGAVGEAIASDGSAVGGILQEGQRYAIPYETTMPSGLSPLGQKVFRALQNYGAFVTDVAGGVTTIGAQQNAYDDETMTDLWHDAGAIIPLLKKVPLP